MAVSTIEENKASVREHHKLVLSWKHGVYEMQNLLGGLTTALSWMGSND